jgi:hypothetical protein
MSKYDPLTSYLQSHPQRELRCSFRDLETVLGFRLPPVSRAHRAWWSNNGSNNVMTKAWLNAGFRAEQVDMAGESLVFRRSDKSEGAAPVPPREPQAPARAIAAPPDDAALIKNVLDVLCGELEQAQQLRRAIIAALPEPKTKTAFDVFGSNLPDEAFDGVFPDQRQSGWREVKL